jgi:hypothetical protein
MLHPEILYHSCLVEKPIHTLKSHVFNTIRYPPTRPSLTNLLLTRGDAKSENLCREVRLSGYPHPLQPRLNGLQ